MSPARKPSRAPSGRAQVDAYLRKVKPDQRAALQRLRQQIKAILPRAEECISYRIPAFRVDGRLLVWYAAMPRHCSFFPGGIVQSFRKELAKFELSKGTIRFQPDAPIPPTLVRKLVKARLARLRSPKERAQARAEIL